MKEEGHDIDMGWRMKLNFLIHTALISVGQKNGQESWDTWELKLSDTLKK